MEINLNVKFSAAADLLDALGALGALGAGRRDRRLDELEDTLSTAHERLGNLSSALAVFMHQHQVPLTANPSAGVPVPTSGAPAPHLVTPTGQPLPAPGTGGEVHKPSADAYKAGVLEFIENPKYQAVDASKLEHPLSPTQAAELINKANPGADPIDPADVPLNFAGNADRQFVNGAVNGTQEAKPAAQPAQADARPRTPSGRLSRAKQKPAETPAPAPAPEVPPGFIPAKDPVEETPAAELNGNGQAPAPEAGERELTIEDVRRVTQDAVFRSADNRAIIKGLLTEIGVDKASDLEAAHWPAYIAKVSVL